MTDRAVSIPGLERSDFIRPPSQTRNRIIYSMQGLTKTGKSTFPMWGPSPVAVFDFDRRLESVVQRAMNGKLDGVPREIVYIPFKMPELDIRSKHADTAVQKHAAEQLNQFLRNFKTALESSSKPDGVRTISIDTGTELQDLRKCAEFGRLIGINPRDLGGANQDIRDWMRLGEDYNANVVWVHHVKDEWKENQSTGRKIIDGYNKADQCVQVVLESSRKGDKFFIKVLDSGLEPATNGKTYGADDWNEAGGPFAFISQQQKPKTEIDDWRD